MAKRHGGAFLLVSVQYKIVRKIVAVFFSSLIYKFVNPIAVHFGDRF